MTIDELVDELEAKNLDFELRENDNQIALYYSEIKRGNKFLEIHADKDDNVTIVKFYHNAILPSSVMANVEFSGDDDNRITKQLKYDNNDKDIFSIAVASYSKVREEWLQKNKKSI